MMHIESITFVAGIISCVIGVSTFISGRTVRAERNGSMETKINQALEGITAINHKLEESSHSQRDIELLVRSHDEKIKTLFREYKELQKTVEAGDKTRETLIELLQIIRAK